MPVGYCPKCGTRLSRKGPSRVDFGPGGSSIMVIVPPTFPERWCQGCQAWMKPEYR